MDMGSPSIDNLNLGNRSSGNLSSGRLSINSLSSGNLKIRRNASNHAMHRSIIRRIINPNKDIGHSHSGKFHRHGDINSHDGTRKVEHGGSRKGDHKCNVRCNRNHAISLRRSHKCNRKCNLRRVRKYSSKCNVKDMDFLIRISGILINSSRVGNRVNRAGNNNAHRRLINLREIETNRLHVRQ